MAKQTWIKDNGVWKKVKSAWVNVNGVWKKDVMPKGVVNGGYKEFMSYFNNIIILARMSNNISFLDIMDENFNVIQSVNLNTKLNQATTSIMKVATDDKNYIYLSIAFNATSSTFYKFDKHLNILKVEKLNNSDGVSVGTITPMPGEEMYVSYGYYHSYYRWYENTIVKFDANFNTIWSKLVANKAYNVATENAVGDNGYVYVKYSDSSRNVLKKYDSNGTLIKIASTSTGTSANTVECYENNIFTNNYSNVLKYDEELNLIWEKHIGNNVRVRDVDAFGNVYANVGGVVHKIDPVGNSTILSNVTNAGLLDTAVDFKNNVYLACASNLRKYRPTGFNERNFPITKGTNRICAYPGKYEQFKNAYRRV